jgi:hypothetical protein
MVEKFMKVPSKEQLVLFLEGISQGMNRMKGKRKRPPKQLLHYTAHSPNAPLHSAPNPTYPHFLTRTIHSLGDTYNRLLPTKTTTTAATTTTTTKQIRIGMQSQGNRKDLREACEEHQFIFYSERV